MGLSLPQSGTPAGTGPTGRDTAPLEAALDAMLDHIASLTNEMDRASD